MIAFLIGCAGFVCALLAVIGAAWAVIDQVRLDRNYPRLKR
jgi:hypothetical protein